MPVKTYHTRPDVVAAWQVNGEELATHLIEKTALPLGLDLTTYRFVGATEATPATLKHYRFAQLRKRFDEGDYIVRDESGRYTVLNPMEFAENYVPAVRE